MCMTGWGAILITFIQKKLGVPPLADLEPPTKHKQLVSECLQLQYLLKSSKLTRWEGNSSWNLIRNPVGLGSLWGSQVGMSIEMSSVVRFQNLALSKNVALKHILSKPLQDEGWVMLRVPSMYIYIYTICLLYIKPSLQYHYPRYLYNITPKSCVVHTHLQCLKTPNLQPNRAKPAAVTKLKSKRWLWCWHEPAHYMHIKPQIDTHKHTRTHTYLYTHIHTCFSLYIHIIFFIYQ